MNTRHFIVASFLTGFAGLASPVLAADLTSEFDAKHKACLEQIAEDADIAYEEAMIWRDDGGGRRARHCEAMALFALGHKEEAAHRLDQLAEGADGGNKHMRANFYAEAADFWLMAEEAENAYASASAGLDLREDYTPLRVARARAYALLGRYADSETDLTNALAFDPGSADAYRYRADARLNLGELQKAKSDIEQALELNPTSVETALLRGRINEAIRKQDIGDVLATPQISDN